MCISTVMCSKSAGGMLTCAALFQGIAGYCLSGVGPYFDLYSLSLPRMWACGPCLTSRGTLLLLRGWSCLRCGSLACWISSRSRLLSSRNTFSSSSGYGGCGGASCAVAATGLFEYVGIDFFFFESATGHTAVEGRWPWRTTDVVVGLAAGCAAAWQNDVARGCHGSSSFGRDTGKHMHGATCCGALLLTRCHLISPRSVDVLLLGEAFPGSWEPFVWRGTIPKELADELAFERQVAGHRDPRIGVAHSDELSDRYSIHFLTSTTGVAWPSSYAAGPGVLHGGVVGGRGSGITYAEKVTGFQLGLRTRFH